MITAWMCTAAMVTPGTQENPIVKVHTGELKGTYNAQTGIQSFKGVPFAAPPVVEFRWREPQPVRPWNGVRDATAFGPRPMQLPLFSDMRFRSPRVDEDCLYLNVWTPAKRKSKLPVLVYFYGGGYVAGDSSEYRYDGESLAKRGIVTVTVNYRLGLFGFMAHPELTKESPFHASGNYGLLDQAASLQWVHDNIASFGGDPKKVTIAGESAGSFSVSAQMASPLSRHLIAGAIGESGALFGRGLSSGSLAEAEKAGSAFAKQVGAKSLADLRAIPAEQLLKGRANPYGFGVTVDGHFFPKPVEEIYAKGEQAHVPLLAGWNTHEGDARSVLGSAEPTPENFAKGIQRLYGSHAEAVLAGFPHANAEEVKESSTVIGGALFIGYGTWKWIDVHSQTGTKPVYRYLFGQPRPGEPGAYHAGEIEYALDNLHLNPLYKWRDEDKKASETMASYFANFIKTGNPNGNGLTKWPALNGKGGGVMYLAGKSEVIPDKYRAGFLAIDKAK